MPAAGRGETDAVAALHDYQTAMLEHAFTAVDRSRGNAGQAPGGVPGRVAA